MTHVHPSSFIQVVTTKLASYTLDLDGRCNQRTCRRWVSSELTGDVALRCENKRTALSLYYTPLLLTSSWPSKCPGHLFSQLTLMLQPPLLQCSKHLSTLCTHPPHHNPSVQWMWAGFRGWSGLRVWGLVHPLILCSGMFSLHWSQFSLVIQNSTR